MLKKVSHNISVRDPGYFQASSLDRGGNEISFFQFCESNQNFTVNESPNCSCGAVDTKPKGDIRNNLFLL